jgi:hypothetical protein
MRTRLPAGSRKAASHSSRLAHRLLQDLGVAGRPHPLERSVEVVGADGRQLSSYRATLDAGGDPAVVSQWITETQAKKLGAGARLRGHPGSAASRSPARMARRTLSACFGVPSCLLCLSSSPERGEDRG